MMDKEVQPEFSYPIQPFVFEFAKDAQKSTNFKDIKPPPECPINLSSLDKYLQENQSFLEELRIDDKNQQFLTFSPAKKEDIPSYWFQPNFNLKKTQTFNMVYPKGCLHRRMFFEQLVHNLDTVQSLLFHSSDNSAIEFANSFSTIHEINTELSEIIRKVVATRTNLNALDKMSSAAITLSKLHKKAERQKSLKETLSAISKIEQAPLAARALAENGEFAEAFDLLNKTKTFTMKRIGGIRSLHGKIAALDQAQVSVINQAKMMFFKLLLDDQNQTNESKISTIIKLLKEQNLLEDTLLESPDKAAEVAKAQVNQIFSQQTGERLSSLPISKFTSIINPAMHTIRNRIITKSTESISRSISLLGPQYEKPLNRVIQKVNTAVFNEVTMIISSQSLEKATLDDYNTLFSALLSFKDYLTSPEDKNLLNTAILTLGQTFVDSMHSDRMKMLKQSFANEDWTLKLPSQNDVYQVSTIAGNFAEGLGTQYGALQVLFDCLGIVGIYVKSAHSIRSLADDIASKLCIIFQLFANECTDYMLKGKMQKKKAISTKNLALSASSCLYLSKLIPFVIAQLGNGDQSVSAKKQALFGPSIKALQTATDNFLGTIIEILHNVISQKIPSEKVWNVKAIVDGIVKEICTLHKVISANFPAEIQGKIFGAVGEDIKQILLKSNGKAQDISSVINGFNEKMVESKINMKINVK